MSQTITVTDLIRRSMYLINAAAAGEIPDTADLNDALLSLNEMLDSWNTQPLAVYGSPTENWTLTPGKSVYTWGVGGDFTSERPVFINDVYCTVNGISTPVRVITQAEYDRISMKAISQSIIEKVLYVNSFPLGQLTIFPAPTDAVTLTFDIGRQFTGNLTLQTKLSLPPGYIRAIRYNLAVELWPEYTNSTTDITSVKDIARHALGEIKSVNNEVSASTFESIPGVELGRSWDWRVG